MYAKKKWLEELPPYQGGGGMINDVKKDSISYGDLPNKYEAGTMATAQVIAFDQSIKFLESIGIDKVFEVDQNLVSETEWFDDEIIGTKHGDFFVKRSINYSKRSQSITNDDLF